MKSLLIFEPNVGGHHPIWLKYIVEDLLSMGFQLTLAVNQPVMQRFFKENGWDIFSKVQWLSVFDEKGAYLKKTPLQTLAYMHSLVRPDHVFLPNLDLILSHVSRLAALGIYPPQSLRGQLSGVYHRPRPLDFTQKSLMNDWKRWGLKQLLNRGWFKSIYFVDEFLAEKVTESFPCATYYTLPDPWEGQFLVDDQSSCRQFLGIQTTDPVLLHYGVGAKRKGLQFILKAFEKLPWSERPFLLIAGQLGKVRGLDSLSDWLAAKKALVLNRYVSDAEEKQCFGACDAVLLPYLSHYGSANVLSRASAAGRWVIASDFHLLGQRVKRYHLGYVFEDQNEKDFLNVFLKAFEKFPSQRPPFELGLKEYAGLTTRISFRHQLLKGFADL